jgi:hypothetical protein
MPLGGEGEELRDGAHNPIQRNAAEAAALHSEVDVAQGRGGQRNRPAGALADLDQPRALGSLGPEALGQRAQEQLSGTTPEIGKRRLLAVLT